MTSQLSPLTPSQELSIIRQGLPKTSSPKSIVIVGAGMAGLVAASLLQDAGHQVTICEARERIGGRVYTLRSPFTDGSYLDVGPMRIPDNHFLTLAYLQKFGLSVHPFINSTPNDWIYANGVKTRRWYYEQHPDILQFPVTPQERGKTADQLLELATKPIADYIRQSPETNWDPIIRAFDQYSMDRFLRHNPVGPSLSSAAIDTIAVLLATEGFPELSFLEILRDLIIFSPTTRFFEITGGFDALPYAFLPLLQENIHFHQKLTKITQHNTQVIIQTTHTLTREPFCFTGDYAIITVPFSILQFVEIEPYPSFSYSKRKAIRQLHYASSDKIGLEFNRRFWEEEGIYGGQTSTDLPIRYAYYPSHDFGQSGGVVLASYTWEDDALPWDSLNEDERIRQALENLATIHGKHIYSFFVKGKSQSWARDPYAGGAFAMFKPDQETELTPYLATPEGRVHFAGEHTSNYRGWIQGAIESGIRVAYELNIL